MISSMGDGDNYDRLAELRAFEESKAGVQGLVASGCNKVPRMFIVPPHERAQATDNSIAGMAVPVIDIGSGNQQDIVEAVRLASEKWGFFQVVGHRIPLNVMERVLCTVRDFHEEKGDKGIKKKLYSVDPAKAVKYGSTFNIYNSRVATWRDTLYCRIMPGQPISQELPDSCKEIFDEYSKNVMKLATNLFEILSEALGLKSTYLTNMECNTHSQILICHYYPSCPEPELTIGAIRHADIGFLNILLQDNIGGLQIVHNDQWVDVPYIAGSFTVNIGDLLQLMSNDKFKSVEHRVVTKKAAPRVSVACFFGTEINPSSTRNYGPIKELLSEENPPLYRETNASDFGPGRKIGLSNFRLST